jgi:hypothetical protein
MQSSQKHVASDVVFASIACGGSGGAAGAAHGGGHHCLRAVVANTMGGVAYGRGWHRMSKLLVFSLALRLAEAWVRCEDVVMLGRG